MSRKNTIKDRIDESLPIELVFSPFIMIDTLLLPEIIGSVRESSTGHAKGHAFQGYRLALVCSVFLYMDSIMRFPGLLGFKEDQGFHDYYFYSKSPGKDTLRSVLRRNHPISGLAARVQSIFSDLLAAKSWEELDEHLGNLRNFSLSLRRIFCKSFKSFEKANSRWHRVDPDDALLKRTYEIVWGQLMNVKFVYGRYTEVYREHRRHNLYLDEDERNYRSSDLSRLQNNNDDLWRNHFPPPEWASGYAQATLLALAKLGPQVVREELDRLHPRAKKAQTWQQVDAISRRVRDILIDIPGFFRPWDKWLFKRYKPVAAINRRALMVPVRTPATLSRSEVCLVMD